MPPHLVLRSSSQPPPPPSPPACRYWRASGQCFLGPACGFSHAALPESPGAAAIPKAERVCRAFLLSGSCKDDGCEFNHSIPGINRPGG
eukprot:SM005417S18196  [mRNA]  locus=s5417:27:900:- [translate_table: standard]